MHNTSNIYCRQIVALLESHGVGTAFCCPGSRNAPLLVALEACDGIFKRVIVDERSAAFQALGCCLVERTPVVLVCTSGTAVLNFAPAIAEAYYAGVPLIVISADRPREWIDQDDSQTIRQFGILDHILKGSYDIRAIPEGSAREYTEEVKWTVNRTVNEALLKAVDGKPGPVHINVQLADPLGGLSEDSELAERTVSLVKTSETVPAAALKELAESAVEAKIMLVAGFLLPDNRLDRAVRSFAALPNVVVMAETLSNLHHPQPMSSMIDAVLCDMTPEQLEDMRPDIVISIGGALVSRMLKQYLRTHASVRHWSVGHSNYFCDCFKSMTEKIEIAPDAFLRQLAGAIKKTRRDIVSDYSSKWQEYRRRSSAKACNYIDKAPWSDLKAMDFIFRNMKFDNLFLSNGTPVRYSQLFEHDCHAEYCNRGVSGIDGCSATAVGAAWSYPGHTTLISGDMSWIYDSGASTLQNLPHDMVMIVIDNSGGGIFRFVKSTSELPRGVLEKYFCVEDLPDIATIASGYGIEVTEVYNAEELNSAVKALSIATDHPRMLVVNTPAETSAEVLKSYFVKSK